jgi:hypothetical protein
LAHASQASRVSTPGAHAADDAIENLTPALVMGVGLTSSNILVSGISLKPSLISWCIEVRRGGASLDPKSLIVGSSLKMLSSPEL